MKPIAESEHRIATVTVEVRYAETDQMGVVHHAVYPIWFELARTQLCRQTGTSYDQIEASGYYLIVTGLEIEYRSSAKYPDQITTECRLERFASRGLRFAYRVTTGDRLLARGSTEHVWVEIASGKPCRIPEALSQPFASLLTPPAP